MDKLIVQAYSAVREALRVHEEDFDTEDAMMLVAKGRDKLVAALGGEEAADAAVVDLSKL